MTVTAGSDVYFDPYDVDISEYKLSPTATVRGWETMPAHRR